MLKMDFLVSGFSEHCQLFLVDNSNTQCNITNTFLKKFFILCTKVISSDFFKANLRGKISQSAKLN